MSTSSTSKIDRLWPWDALGVSLWLLWSHWRPQEAFPEWRAMGLAVWTAAILLRGLVAVRMQGLARPALITALIFIALPLWAWVATVMGINPPAGAVVLGTLMQGAMAALWGALVVMSRRSSADATLRGGILALGLLALLLCLWGLYAHQVQRHRSIAELEALVTPQDYETQALLHNLREGRMRSSLGDPNHLGLIAAAGCIGLVAGAMWTGSALTRWGLLAAAAVTAVAEVMTASRGGMLSLLGGFTVLLLAWLLQGRRGRGRMSPLLLGAIALLLLGAGGLALLLSPTLLERLTNTATITERLGYWSIAWQVFLKNPLMGEGLGGFVTWYPSLRPPGLGTAQFAHCLPLQLLADIGLVGLLVSLLPALLFVGPRRALDSPVSPGAGSAWLAVMTCFAINSLIQHSILFRELWIDAMLLLGLGAGWSMSRGETRETNSPLLALLSAVPVIALIALVAPREIQRARAELLQMAGRVAWESGQAQETLDLTEELIACEPDFDRWRSLAAARFLWLAQVIPARSSEFLDQARANLSEAHALNPLLPSVHATRARIASLLGQRQAAVDHQRRAVELHPAEVAHRAQLAIYLLEAGNATQAEIEARAALAIDPHDVDALMALARTLYQRDQHAEALEHARLAAQLEDIRADTWLLISQIEYSSGEIDAARLSAQSALERDPQSPEIQGWVQRLGAR
ncbi:O-antigen ligase family protein [Candidatus Sumerlaeota bacterium]|nr:O-antigen ligase family protein [Candidatus Sumerlaeota bacterium]